MCDGVVTRMSDSVCMCTSQVTYVDRKCYANGIIEALCTCWPQPAAPVNSGKSSPHRGYGKGIYLTSDT